VPLVLHIPSPKSNQRTQSKYCSDSDSEDSETCSSYIPRTISCRSRRPSPRGCSVGVASEKRKVDDVVCGMPDSRSSVSVDVLSEPEETPSPSLRLSQKSIPSSIISDSDFESTHFISNAAKRRKIEPRTPKLSTLRRQIFLTSELHPSNIEVPDSSYDSTSSLDSSSSHDEHRIPSSYTSTFSPNPTPSTRLSFLRSLLGAYLAIPRIR
jgi:hypothetical protein